MDDTVGLVAFLTARLDGLALEAKAGTLHTRGCATWRRLYENGPSATRYGCDCIVVNWLLIDIEAKRQMIAEHPTTYGGDCGTCVDGQWGYPTHGGSTPKPSPCPSLRLLASPFDWHPDYREEWRP